MPHLKEISSVAISRDMCSWKLPDYIYIFLCIILKNFEPMKDNLLIDQFLSNMVHQYGTLRLILASKWRCISWIWRVMNNNIAIKPSKSLIIPTGWTTDHMVLKYSFQIETTYIPLLNVDWWMEIVWAAVTHSDLKISLKIFYKF